jgi:hydroxymethylpyrimidine/phosphomethylpyrimidine kinase
MAAHKSVIFASFIMSDPHRVAMTIAGSDSGGGAGIQADLKTFEAHGLFGVSVVTALTAQNTVGVQGSWGVPPEFVRAQFQSLTADFQIGAAKTGMLFQAETIVALAELLGEVDFPLVIDPVMRATSGDMLLQPEAVQALQDHLLPLATVLTPNLGEAEVLVGKPVQNRADMEAAARHLAVRYPHTWILIKGGHLQEDTSADLLFHHGQSEWFLSPRIPTQDTHGTGCTLAAAITSRLAMGASVSEAVHLAKDFVTHALRHAWHGLGKGRGSLRHNFAAI